MNRGKRAGSLFSGKQGKAIELLAGGGMTQEDICDELGICRNTMWEWKKNPEFMNAVVNRARDLLKHSLPTIYKTLAEKAAEGNHRHIKILMDHMDRLEEMTEQYTGGEITVKWKGSWDEEELNSPEE